MKIEPPAPPRRLRHLDAHQAQLEEPGNERRLEPAGFVHRPDQRPHLGLGELPDCVAEHPFLFG